MDQNFMYQSEKLNAARRCLMAPHPDGEAKGFAQAFSNCSLAFERFNIDLVDNDDARDWIKTIRRTMDTTGLEDTSGQGLYQTRAEMLTYEEKAEFSRVIDELASWFTRKFWTAK